VEPGAQRALLDRFLAALAADDREGVLAVLDAGATWVSDGGGKVSAATRQVVGAERVARMVLGWERKGRGVVEHAIETVNGEPAIVSRYGGKVFATTSVAVAEGRIVALYRVMNPEKLRGFGA
jgi:RNA polymerase sigma-70 factor (ECF subfamily)